MLVLNLPFNALFFFNDTATTEIYTLSLHDALPICLVQSRLGTVIAIGDVGRQRHREILQLADADRKSTRLNSSHQIISYAVFCLKKKKTRTSGRQECDYQK